MWQSVSIAPFNCDLQLAVIDEDGTHELIFPCRRVAGGWVKVNAKSEERLDLLPTHWRLWQQQT